MAALPGRPWTRIAGTLVFLLVGLAGLAATACGGETIAEATRAPEAGVIMSSGRSYTIDDLKAVGYKLSKTYDVTDLPQALAAYFGFWGLDPYKRAEFEARFYPDHATAVQYGQDLARERVGPDAKLTEETATWKVGVVDARECHGLRGQSQHAAKCTEAVYYDYAIVDNMILLCPGDAMDVARKNCATLLEHMKK